MREIREVIFRGKRTDNGEWVYGYYTKARYYLNEKEMYVIFTPDGEAFPRCEFSDYEEVDPETVCQYTGLTDKNGRKIFEGDIVEGNSEYFTYTHPYGKIVYDGGQYLISFDHVLEDIECWGAWANDVEIIGNIYDNPELLEGS